MLGFKALVLFTVSIRKAWAQDEGENLNIRLGENPYMFLYYDLEEKLDDFYNTRENQKVAIDLLKKGKAETIKVPEPKPPAADDGACPVPEPEEELVDGVKPYTGEYEIFVDRKAPPVNMFLGYLNVTEEDESVWDTSNQIRLCLHIWDTSAG